MRLTITRGKGNRGLNFPNLINPTVLMTIAPLQAQRACQPSRVMLTSIRRNEHSPLAGIKSLSYLDNILARRSAVTQGFDEAILLNTAGNVAEASAANVFIVTHDNTLLTPRLKDGALPGVTRKKVLELATKLSISSEEKSITPEELLHAKEIFLTNSVIEIQPVNQVCDHMLCCDKDKASMTHQLRDAYQSLVNAHHE